MTVLWSRSRQFLTQLEPVGAGAAKKVPAPAPAPIVPQKLKTVGNRFFNFR